MEHKPPTAVIQAAHGEHSLPLHDTTDFDDADRGFIAALSPCVIKAADGRVVWDNDAYSFLDGAAPTSVHPSLWRQSQLTAKQGLYQVVPGIYQVRGFDISNISFVEGDTGLIVIDPLVSTEVAAAALDLYRAHRGADRPVVAVIYTHSHVDHFGGVLGVTTQADVDAGKVAVLAPEGFTAHAVQENIYAGSAMMRRAGYILDEANVIVALAAYTTALLVRAVLEALDAVPAQVHDAATAIGYSRIAQMLKVELPLSIPVLVAGLRVVAVTNIAMVSVGSVIGIGGLGTWFTAGYQTNKSDQIVAGVVAMFLLAIVVDVVINLAGRLATPWERAPRAARRRRQVAAPITGGAR